ncbi:MAG: hypothetical protein KJ893_03715 [Candidatus Omnitrophica bacterium]|nr:hypothetical protein [Candidatus Omnitrophota bacterium]MBU4479710.1 hypothetical protein [Candidatus Omnitrophota bacterium]MCG2703499.1 hypothetical protein [Candidatus Omnitrophota bacterium]
MKKNIIWYTVLLSFFFCSAAFAEEAPQAWKYYNQGVDSYHKLDYNKAVENFQQALNTEDKQLEQWSNYNAASVYFKQAQKLESGNQEQALRNYENSRQFFRRAIELNPRDKDAKYNYEVTLRKIEELKKKQPQGQQKPEDKPQDKNAAGEKQPEPAAGRPEEKKDAGAEAQAGSRREMSKEEALMLLENFQQAEKAQDKLLLQEKERQAEQESGKDW